MSLFSIAEHPVLIIVRNNLKSTPVTPDFTTNDAFSVCAIAVGRRRYEMLVVVVYRAPWASVLITLRLLSLETLIYLMSNSICHCALKQIILTALLGSMICFYLNRR